MALGLVTMTLDLFGILLRTGKAALIEQRSEVGEGECAAGLRPLSDFLHVHTGTSRPIAACASTALTALPAATLRSTLQERLQAPHFAAELLALFPPRLEQPRDAVRPAVVFVDVSASDAHFLQSWLVFEQLGMGLLAVFLEGADFLDFFTLNPQEVDVALMVSIAGHLRLVHGLEFKETAEVPLLAAQ